MPRKVYTGPKNNDRDRWRALFQTMPPEYRKWVMSNAMYLYSKSNGAGQVSGLGVEGSQELVTKLLIFLVKNKGMKGKRNES